MNKKKLLVALSLCSLLGAHGIFAADNEAAAIEAGSGRENGDCSFAEDTNYNNDSAETSTEGSRESGSTPRRDLWALGHKIAPSLTLQRVVNATAKTDDKRIIQNNLEDLTDPKRIDNLTSEQKDLLADHVATIVAADNISSETGLDAFKEYVSKHPVLFIAAGKLVSDTTLEGMLLLRAAASACNTEIERLQTARDAFENDRLTLSTPANNDWSTKSMN